MTNKLTHEDAALLHIWIKYAKECLQSLKPAQHEILQYLLEGYSHKMIAAHLGISLGAVEQRIHRLFHALGVNTERDAISLAILGGSQRGFSGLLQSSSPGH